MGYKIQRGGKVKGKTKNQVNREEQGGLKLPAQWNGEGVRGELEGEGANQMTGKGLRKSVKKGCLEE